MADLSPAAQAVLDAVRAVPILLNDHQERVGIAAALRAAANAITPEPPESKPGASPVLKAVHWERKTTREQLLAIAAELEGA